MYDFQNTNISDCLRALNQSCSKASAVILTIGATAALFSGTYLVSNTLGFTEEQSYAIAAVSAIAYTFLRPSIEEQARSA